MQNKVTTVTFDGVEHSLDKFSGEVGNTVELLVKLDQQRVQVQEQLGLELAKIAALSDALNRELAGRVKKELEETVSAEGE
jgi:hypothetical protein